MKGQVMALSRARDELVERNQKLLLERKQRQQRLMEAQKEQMQLTQAVWTSFLACKVATEELKRCMYCPSRGIASRKPVTGLFQDEQSFNLMGGKYFNLLETSKECATTTTSSSSSSNVGLPLRTSPTSTCRHADVNPPFFKMDNDLIHWEHLDEAISF